MACSFRVIIIKDTSFFCHKLNSMFHSGKCQKIFADGSTYSINTAQTVNGKFDTVVIRYTATPAKIKAKETYYFQYDDIKSADLIKRASATDVKDGDISNKIFVDKIKYPDKTVTRPDKLETGKLQDVTVTYGVTNSRGVTSYADAKIHIVKRGADLETDTDLSLIHI